ncbi:amidohydrolase family protein [Microbacterium lacticum]
MTTHFPAPRIVRNVRLGTSADAEATAVDLHLDDGVITGIHPAARASDGAPGGAEDTVDGRCLLALPGLVNTHAHIDKSWWGLPWQSYGGEGGTEGRIRHERARRDELGIPSLGITQRVLTELVRHGTTAIRTHVDVDPGLGLRGIEVVREAVADYGDALTVEVVAFPQDGVLRRPGVLEMLADAARAGADHLGGLDPATIDRDPVGQIDAVLALAAEHGVGVDIHLHDPAELGAFQIELIVDRTEALPLVELDAAGVRRGFGTDGIRDRGARTAPVACSASRGSTPAHPASCATTTCAASSTSPREPRRRSPNCPRAASSSAPGPISCCSTRRMRWMPWCALPRATR